MNNAAKFIITALVIIAAVFIYKTYQTGGFDDIKPATTQTETTH